MDKFIKLINSLPINEQDIMLENHFSYLYIKANQFLKLGVDAYRMGDFFNQPPDDMSKKEITIIRKACKQIIKGNGFIKSKPLTGIGVAGFYDVMRLIHFKLKSRKTIYQYTYGKERGALDCITFEHFIDVRETTLYNICDFCPIWLKICYFK